MVEADDHSQELFESFAEAVSALDKLTKIEDKVVVAIEKSRVPWRETRKLLKCMSADQVSNTTLFQFLQSMFKEMGLGDLEVRDVDRFEMTFAVKDCEICKFYTGKRTGKVCFIIADALLMFFVKDMDLPCSVNETKCTKEGNDSCEFRVEMQPLGVYKIALDEIDRTLINDILTSKFGIKKFADEHLMEEAEVEYRLLVLESYQIINGDHDVTEIGTTYHKFAQGLRALEEDFEPPWKDLSEITSVLAKKDSFAEAIGEVFNPEPFIQVDSSEMVNLAEEAKKSKSFAELISKYMKTTE